MAMELYVFSDRRLASIAEWQRAINAERFSLRLLTETPFEELDGICKFSWATSEPASSVFIGMRPS